MPQPLASCATTPRPCPALTSNGRPSSPRGASGRLSLTAILTEAADWQTASVKRERACSTALAASSVTTIAVSWASSPPDSGPSRRAAKCRAARTESSSCRKARVTMTTSECGLHISRTASAASPPAVMPAGCAHSRANVSSALSPSCSVSSSIARVTCPRSRSTLAISPKTRTGRPPAVARRTRPGITAWNRPWLSPARAGKRPSSRTASSSSRRPAFRARPRLIPARSSAAAKARRCAAVATTTTPSPDRRPSARNRPATAVSSPSAR